MEDFTIERLVGLRRLSDLAVSPCGTFGVVSVMRLKDAEKSAYTSSLWKIPLNGGPPQRLTQGAWGDRSPCFRNDGALGFLSTRPHPEKKEEEPLAQVWILPKDGGEAYPITEEAFGVTAFRFASEADRLLALAPVLVGVEPSKQREVRLEGKKSGASALLYKKMPIRFWDRWLSEEAPHLLTFDGEGQGRKDRTPQADREYRESTVAISPDGRWGAISEERDGADRETDSAWRVVDLQLTGAETNESWLGGEEASVRVFAPVFSQDGRKLAYARSKRGPSHAERQTLCVLSMETREVETIPLVLERRLIPVAWLPSSEGLLCTGEDGVSTAIWSVQWDGTARRLSSKASGGTHTDLVFRPPPAVSPLESAVTSDVGRGLGGRKDEGLQPTILGLRSTSFQPPEVFSLALHEESEPILLTNLSGFTQADAQAFAQRETRWFQGDGGEAIETLLFWPQEKAEVEEAQGTEERSGRTDAIKKRPLLFWIHGGPISHWPDGWHWRWNPLVFVAAGYAVALPNPRGSTGYGQAFVDGIWQNQWGAACYRDLMGVVDGLEEDPRIDKGRMVAMGGSFGGYMTNWIGGSTDRFRALVTHASVYDMTMFRGTTDRPAYWDLQMGGLDPFHDKEAMARYSPHSQITRWKTPTLIIHGEKDYRVPISESLVLFEALQRLGVKSEFLAFPDENHWILKPKNIEIWTTTILRFLQETLEIF